MNEWLKHPETGIAEILGKSQSAAERDRPKNVTAIPEWTQDTASGEA